MATSIVVGSVLFSCDELFWVEQLAVCARPYFIDYCGFQVDEYRPRYVFSGSGLAEESVETVVSTPYGFVRGHLTIGLDAVFQAVQFPTGIADLDSGLADVH